MNVPEPVQFLLAVAALSLCLVGGFFYFREIIASAQVRAEELKAERKKQTLRLK